MEMAEGTVNCLHCSHSNISVDEMKCHILSQHPTQSAVALNIHGSEKDITFFCVKETCEYSTTVCNDYEKHLMGCLNFNEIFDVLKERLHSSIIFLLGFHSRHGLEAALEFKDFVSSVFDYNEFVDSHVTSPSHYMKGTHWDTHVSNTCASVPQNLNGIKLENDNGCYNQISMLKNESDEVVDMNGSPHSTFTSTIKKESNTAHSFIDHLVSGNPDLENNIASELSHDLVSGNPDLENNIASDLSHDTVSDFLSMEAVNDNLKTENHSEMDTVIQNSTSPLQCGIAKRLNTSLNVKDRSKQKEDSMRKPKSSYTNSPGKGKSKPSMTQCTESVRQRHPSDLNIIPQKDSVCWECFRKSVFCLDTRNDTLCFSKGDDHIEVPIHHERELATQSGGMSFKCKESQKTFGQISHFHNQMKIHEGFKLNRFKCGRCSKTFGLKSELSRHLRVHAGDKLFKCKECGQIFRNKSILTGHMRIHTGEKPFQCKECGKSFQWKSCLKNHMRIHTGEKPFQCNECGQAFRQKSNLSTHMRMHTGEKPFQCKECGQTFILKGSLKSHMSIHTGEKPFQCKECGRAFRQKSPFNTHMRIHTGEKPFQCKECGQAFRGKGSLKTHMSIHTGEKPFQCKECGKAFRRKCDLNDHMRIHTGEKPFKCKECGQSFRWKSYLHKHMSIHTGEKPFQCKECGQAFRLISDLNDHIRIHTGEKPFQCKECGKAFRLKSYLDSHMKIHTGEKPFQCKECGKPFKRKTDLNHHIMRMHACEKPFQCIECGQAFKWKSHLNTHTRIHTGSHSNVRNIGRPLPLARKVIRVIFCVKSVK